MTCKQQTKRGILVRGENNGRAKLSAQQVEEVRRTHNRSNKEASVQALAARYGVTPRAIYLILSGKRWANTAPDTHDNSALAAIHHIPVPAPTFSPD